MLPSKSECSARLPCLLLLLAVGLTACPLMGATEPTLFADKPAVAAGIEGLLVLNNGSVLSGKVQRSGQWYRISQADHSLMEVRAERVDSFYRTLAEAYQARCPQELQTTPRKHLAGADWCLRQGLLAEAAEQLQAARRLDSQHRELRRLEGLLELKKSSETKPVKRVAKEPRSAPIALATHQEVAKVTATEEFSLESRREFVRSIQPMLVQGCSTSGCHSSTGTPSQGFQLDRSALNGTGDARLIQQNFASVVAQLDRQDLEKSPLLQLASNAHGASKHAQPGLEKPSKPMTRHQLELLHDWSQSVVGSDSSVQADTAENGTTNNNVTASEQEPQSQQTVRDEFDPAIFNRRHAADSR
ncbi:hypothetical protein [Adhaeretor mobilis]|uniref:Secreted protein n=1 Tax=Adhaeretor mobilis TaxID=1930276 RepID=A0A517MU89_9BACT|nr:hypothetical protein [Adhaeretor mobilis]QDS98446.1 hypothetical protein HG15A2_17250 [Adhaeretor mobilis]